ncbi:hypothetical protein ABH920_003189 [Catenulispora sp. EB89]
MRVDESRRDYQARDIHNLVGLSDAARRQHPDAAPENPDIKRRQRRTGPIRHQTPAQNKREPAHRSPAGSTPLRATSSSILSAARNTWNRTTSPSDTSNPNTGGIGRLLYWNGEEK